MIKDVIPLDVLVLTRDEFMELEIEYWNKTTPIGYIFAFGAVMGLIVGLIIFLILIIVQFVGVPVVDLDDHVVEHGDQLVGQVVDGLGHEPLEPVAGHQLHGDDPITGDLTSAELRGS